MADLPYMKWYPRDFQTDAAHLTPMAELAYRRILEFMWLRGGELEINQERLCRLARVVPQRWKPVWDQIESFFEKTTDGKITQGRISKDYSEAQSLSNSRALSGSAGGKAKANKINGPSVAIAKNASGVSQHTPRTIYKRGNNGLEEKRENPYWLPAHYDDIQKRRVKLQ